MQREMLWRGIFGLIWHLIRSFEFDQVEEDNRATIDPNG